MPATLPQLLRSDCLHAPSQNPTTRYSPKRNRPQSTARNTIQAQPVVASTRSQRSCPPVHAAYQKGPATSAASSFRGSVPATLPQLVRCNFLHAPPTLGSPLGKPPPSARASHPTASAYSTQQHPCTAGGRKHPLTAQLPPMHAAYRRGPATSAASSFRDSVPATLPHHLRSHFLHAPAAPRLSARKPHQPLQPGTQPPQPTTRKSSMLPTRHVFSPG